MSETVVYIRSALSRTHVAVLRDGIPYTAESCDLADIDPDSREIVYSLAEVAPAEKCPRCFPSVVVQGHEESVTS